MIEGRKRKKRIRKKMIRFSIREKKEPENGSESPEKPRSGTSGKLKCIKKHCLRCRKFYNHRHTGDEKGPCALCPCTYFYGWDNVRRRKGLSQEEWTARLKKKHQKPDEVKAENKIEQTA